jgi:hypothetical protein
MRLPESIYKQVLLGLGLDDAGLLDRHDGGPARAADGSCNRRSYRRRLNMPVHFVRHGAISTTPQTCTLVDLSRDGVGVLMDAVAAPGDRFVLYLPRAGDDGAPGEVLAILCTARSSRLKNGGKFRAGAEFTDPTEHGAEQTRFARAADGLESRPGRDAVWVRTAGRPELDPDGKARRDDRREVAGTATIYLYRDDGNHGPVEHVEARDYSERGVGVLRDKPLEIGEEFVVRMPRADETPITRLCRVANVALAGGRYRIGAEFIPFPGPNGRGFFARLREWIA